MNKSKAENYLKNLNRRITKNHYQVCFLNFQHPPSKHSNVSILALYQNKRGFGWSGKVLKHELKYPQLTTPLSMIGAIGDTGFCKNRIGFCCEVKASHILIAKSSKPYAIKLNHIQFTRALRIRTNQYVKRCKNCVSVFGKE